MSFKSQIEKVKHKYNATCKIYYDSESNIILWKGFFKNYKAIFTRSEGHQQLKLSYGEITFKITYITLPKKLGVYKGSKLYRLPSFVSINNNHFKITDVISLLTDEERQKVEESIENKIEQNSNLELGSICDAAKNIIKTLALGYSLFTRFIAFLNKEYEDFYNIIINYKTSMEKSDINEFLYDSCEFDSIEALSVALERALEEEDYEKALEIKNKIELLKNKNQ